MRDLTAVVVTGGDAVPRSVLGELPSSVWVVAADAGLELARSIGLHVDVLVGDLDSVPGSVLEGFAGRVDRHPSDKDQTDLDLALGLVSGHGHIERVIVLGGAGGRLDHLLGNVAVLSAARYAHLGIEWLTATDRTHVVWDHVQLHGTRGDRVSLLAVGGEARGVTTKGLRWQLDSATLEPGMSLGISNEFAGSVATITVAGGRLLAIQECEAADDHP